MLNDVTLAFYPAPRSACSATTARASRRCCGSWPASTPTSAARRCSPPARRSACSSRSRSSTRARTCAGTSSTASPRRKALIDRFNELSVNYSDETADEFAELQAKIDAADGWNLDTDARLRDGRAAPARRPTPTSPRSPAASAAASRSAACCSARPTCCSSTSPPTTSTPSRSRWLERYLADYKGTVVAVTHDRYFLDNVAGWILELDRGRGIPYEGNYSRWLEQKQKRLAQEEQPDRPAAHDRGRARVGPQEPQGPPDQAEGAHHTTTRPWSPRSRTSSSTTSRSTSRSASAWATWSCRPRTCARASATSC